MVINLLKVAYLFLLVEKMTNWCFKRLKNSTFDSVESKLNIIFFCG